LSTGVFYTRSKAYVRKKWGGRETRPPQGEEIFFSVIDLI
jgi:hypothetical protein